MTAGERTSSAHARALDDLVRTAVSSKHAGHDDAKTAMGWFGRYCAQVGYTVPIGPAYDPLEVQAMDGSAPLGRLVHFTGWLLAALPNASPDSISGYVSTVRQRCAALYNWEFIFPPVLRHFFHRKRQQPRQRRYRDPAPVALIKAVFDDGSIQIGIRTAILVAYQALLRAREFCSERARSLQRGLASTDVKWVSHAQHFVVKVSGKSDMYNQGELVPIQRDPVAAVAGADYCPVRAMQAYIAAEPASRLPGQAFFIKRVDGRPSNVVVDDVSQALKKHAAGLGCNVERISSHSIRIGAAFQLASAGVDWQTIGVRGRWSPVSTSKMAQMYARMSTQRLDRVASALSLAQNPGDCAIFPSYN